LGKLLKSKIGDFIASIRICFKNGERFKRNCVNPTSKVVNEVFFSKSLPNFSIPATEILHLFEGLELEINITKSTGIKKSELIVKKSGSPSSSFSSQPSGSYPKILQ